METTSSEEERIANARGLKVHVRLVPIGRFVFRVVTLRPSTTARYSTNLFHNTWHILTNREGARVLARLLWGLAFQKRPGTVVMIEGEHLTTTPFDADRPDRIVLANIDLTRLRPDLLRALKRRLDRTRIENTARWQTFGLIDAPDPPRGWAQRDCMERIGGMLCYSADGATLREQARVIYRMHRCESAMDYHYVGARARRYWHVEGEVQVFRDMDDMVSAARVARRAVAGDAPILSDAQRSAIWSETERYEECLRGARDKG